MTSVFTAPARARKTSDSSASAPTHRRALLATVALVGAVTLAACSTGNYPKVAALTPSTLVTAAASSAAAAAPSLVAPGLPAPADDPFYQPPTDYAASKPGTVLRSRHITLSSRYQQALPSSGGYQLLYRTTSVDGSSTATVATVLLPAKPGPQPRNLVSDQVPEDSLTTACAPSYLIRQAAPAGGVSFDTTLIGAALAHGWDVVISDYEGPDSELLVGPLEGRETLDGIRAAENFAPDGLNGAATKVGLQGYSGGSVPTIWAGSLAASYTPRLNIVGLAAGGIDANLDDIIARSDHSTLFGGVMLALIGLSRAYPELDLPRILNARGSQSAAIDGRDGYGCAAAVAQTPGGTVSQYTNYQTSQALAALPALVTVTSKTDAVAAAAPRVPTYLYNTVHDENMNISQVDALYSAYCHAGSTVYYDRSSVGDHLTGDVTFGLKAPLYLAARFSGQSAQSTCSSQPNDPKQ